VLLLLWLLLLLLLLWLMFPCLVRQCTNYLCGIAAVAAVAALFSAHPLRVALNHYRGDVALDVKAD